MTIRNKLVLFGISGTLVPLILLGTVAIWNAGSTEATSMAIAKDNSLAGFDRIVQGVYTTVQAQAT